MTVMFGVAALLGIGVCCGIVVAGLDGQVMATAARPVAR